MNLNMLSIMFKSLLGDVTSEDFFSSLELMWKGMIGIFIVMVLIFLLIYILGKTTGNNKGDDN